ncbi:phycobilisome protein [Synechocystis sp. LKSZ1]|uniref:phycobilisome protein n=1 Tax=Synechocystis sp. LKSZ1 TaxID=3144951 RepID=UPI00336C1A82
MQRDFERLFHRAEDHYLHALEVASFQKHLGLLQERLAAYRYLRDHELDIFQTLADRLEMAYPDTPTPTLEKALLHWISILRYSAMGMLLSNPEYLQYRLLEWLGDMVTAHDLHAIENTLAEALVQYLQEALPEAQFTLLRPFLAQAETTVLGQAQPQPEQLSMAGEQG